MKNNKTENKEEQWEKDFYEHFIVQADDKFYKTTYFVELKSFIQKQNEEAKKEVYNNLNTVYLARKDNHDFPKTGEFGYRKAMEDILKNISEEC